MRRGGPLTNKEHEGHRAQASVHFSLLGFHGLLSLYGSLNCVLPRPTCVMFLRNCEFSHSTSWLQIYGVCQMFKDNCLWKDQRNKCLDSCKDVYGVRLVSLRINKYSRLFGSFTVCIVSTLGSLPRLFPWQCVCFKVVLSFKVQKLLFLFATTALKFFSGFLRWFSFIVN